MFNLLSNLFVSKPKTIITEDVEHQSAETIQRPVIVMIHGANATSRSFAYIQSHLSSYKTVAIDYNSANGFYNNLENIVQHTATLGPLFIIAHSLGGIYALHMLQRANVKQVFSVSVPFGGSPTADWARYMLPNYQLFREIGTRSKPIVQGKNIKIDVPWTQIVTTRGSSPFFTEKNDGVVTLASMTCRTDVQQIFVEENHYEVMASDYVVSLIKEQYETLQI